MHSPLTLVGLMLAVLAPDCVEAAPDTTMRFSVHRLESGVPGPTLLVVGGIQGDEPGGFNAASLLTTDYRIERGEVWVVPNLNFASMVRNSRGVHGDLNRKFARVEPDDPDLEAVQAIKRLILDQRVDAVLNLHDGSGFFRERHVDRWNNPRRWGQCVVIDRRQIGTRAGDDLLGMASRVTGRINARLLDSRHRYRVKNTRTHLGDKEMEKTLTYFAIRHSKAAFGIEASKFLPLQQRVYYHLRAIEAFMHELGLHFRRAFPLGERSVADRLQGRLELALYKHKILLELSDARSALRYIPLKKRSPLTFSASSPIVAVYPSGNHFTVSNGNRQVTRLHPQYFDYDDSLSGLAIRVDGRERIVPLGSVVEAFERFTVAPMDGYRVNVIGYKRRGVRNESGVQISRREIEPRFSVDRAGSLFRVEVYRGARFSGMVLVRFSEPARHAAAGSDPDRVALAQLAAARGDADVPTLPPRVPLPATGPGTPAASAPGR